VNDAILIQHIHPGYGFEPLLDLNHDRNEAYCDRHHMDYWPERWNDERYPAITGAWLKIVLMIQALEKDYQSIFWLDADTLIWDLETDLREAIQPGHIGACWHRIPQLHHWNVGALYLDNTPQVLRFLRAWLASYPAPPDGWNEQGVFNRLARASGTVVTVSDRWNATLDVNMVPDAVVLGFHGQGPAEHRLDLMKRTLGDGAPAAIPAPIGAVNGNLQ
jgi:hypothetical protein